MNDAPTMSNTNGTPNNPGYFLSNWLIGVLLTGFEGKTAIAATDRNLRLSQNRSWPTNRITPTRASLDSHG